MVFPASSFSFPFFEIASGENQYLLVRFLRNCQQHFVDQYSEHSGPHEHGTLFREEHGPKKLLFQTSFVDNDQAKNGSKTKESKESKESNIKKKIKLLGKTVDTGENCLCTASGLSQEEQEEAFLTGKVQKKLDKKKAKGKKLLNELKEVDDQIAIKEIKVILFYFILFYFILFEYFRP